MVTSAYPQHQKLPLREEGSRRREGSGVPVGSMVWAGQIPPYYGEGIPSYLAGLAEEEEGWPAGKKNTSSSYFSPPPFFPKSFFFSPALVSQLSECCDSGDIV